MNNRSVRVKIPASTANLGSGFDAVGMAFQLYTTILMREAETTVIELHGKELQDIPTDKSNLLYQVASSLYREAGLADPELFIEVQTDVPLTRGLGSSAAAIVGALVAANSLAGEPFSKDQLFYMASKWEGHPDNVGASLFGGIIVATMPEEEEGQVIPYVRLDVPEGLKTLVVIPQYLLSTEKARHILPETYQKKDVVYSIGRSALLIAALATGKLEVLSQAMKDRMHQPYRSQLVPGLSEMLSEAYLHGAIGTALSGAGPTVLFFYKEDSAKQQLLSFIDDLMGQHQIPYETLELLSDETGVEVDVLSSIGS